MIELLNVKEGDCFPHSIVYVLGRCPSSSSGTASVALVDHRNIETVWRVESNGYFKAFVSLNHGRNNLIFKSTTTIRTCTLKMTLFRSSLMNKKTNRLIRVLYVITKDDGNNYEDDESLNGDLKRVSLGVNLLQTFYSEELWKKFKQRKTFALKTDFSAANNADDENHDSDSNNLTDLCCEIYRSNLSSTDALNLAPNELFISLAEQIKSDKRIFNINQKYLAILSFTKYDLKERKLRGHCALGAEWLAVYGTPCLSVWSDCLSNLEKYFSDCTPIDENSSTFYNDSAFRNTNWACYATTLGSLMHELSHVVDLGHDLTGIMARGFDDLDRFFTIKFDQSCTCYEDFQERKVNNFLIKNVMTYSNESKNADLNLMERSIKKYANDDELIYYLVETEKNEQKQNRIAGRIKSSEIQQRQSSKCKCLRNCSFTDSNLLVLYFSKWFNNVFQLNGRTNDEAKNQEDSESKDSLAAVFVDYENRVVRIQSTRDKLELIELRTLNGSFTFHFERIDTTNGNSNASRKEGVDDRAAAQISFETIREKFNKFQLEFKRRNKKSDVDCRLKNSSNKDENFETPDQFELLMLDSSGNITKTKFKI